MPFKQCDLFRGHLLEFRTGITYVRSRSRARAGASPRQFGTNSAQISIRHSRLTTSDLGLSRSPGGKYRLCAPSSSRYTVLGLEAVMVRELPRAGRQHGTAGPGNIYRITQSSPLVKAIAVRMATHALPMRRRGYDSVQHTR